MTQNMMNQTQRLRVTHKVIIHAIRRQLLTLSTGKKVTHTSNGNFEQTLLSNRTIPVVVPSMKPRIQQRIEQTVVAPQTPLPPETKEGVTDAALVGVWVNRTLRRVSRTGVNGRNTGDIHHAVSVEHAPYPVLIVVVVTYSPCGINGILKVANK